MRMKNIWIKLSTRQLKNIQIKSHVIASINIVAGIVDIAEENNIEDKQIHFSHLLT